MRERKFKKSHIHILQTETLSRESRVTESVQEIVDSPLYLRTIDLCLPYVNTIVLLLGGCFTRMWGGFRREHQICGTLYFLRI